MMKHGAWSTSMPSWGPLSDDGFPTVWGIAGVAAALTASAPWLSRGWRRPGWRCWSR